ncbi:MAG: DUF3291 domain-containing protein [SAR202 cluster bacterium]|nr:DUF3291 domain-containing protein [SAR202 cluster bacterium]
MADIKWKTLTDIKPDQEYLVMASFLPLRGLWRVPRFLFYTADIQKQLNQTRGVVGYGLRALLLKRRFYTLSAWESQEALSEFNRAMPHSEIAMRLKRRMGKSKFVFWKAKGSGLPPTWDQAFSRLAMPKEPKG